MKKSIYLLLLASFAGLSTFGQDKLKDVQETPLWAAQPVKVDGALAELNDSFQAYNKHIKLYYTVSNDSKYLYLQLKSNDATNNAKIQAGGITFTVNTDNKKKEEDAFAITYPVVKRQQRGQRGAGGAGGPGGGGRGNFGGGGFGAFGARGGTVDSAAQREANNQFIAASKEIKVSGFKDIPDSLVSIYNEYSIKAAMGFNAQGNFTYEIAIPLKELGITPTKAKEFSYNIKLNGLQMGARFNNRDGGGDNAGGAGGPGGAGGFGGGGAGGFGGGGGGARGGRAGGFGGGNAGGGGARGGNINFEEMISPTDFWGKYTLAHQ